MSFSLSLSPLPSSRRLAPLSVTISGPFARGATGHPPVSDFTLAISAQGRTGSLAIISTATAGYLTIGRSSYTLPASSLSKLASGLSPVDSSGRISSLGIEPLSWLVHPVALGRAGVGGTATAHVRAGVDPRALARGLGTVLAATSSLTGAAGTALKAGLSQAAQKRIASGITAGSVDIFSGVRDRTLRRLVLALTLPISGRLSSLLGKVRSARLVITLQYTQLNRPQTIVAPVNALPYSSLAAALGSSTTPSTTTPSGTTPSTTTPSGTTESGQTGAQANSAWTRCIEAAGQDVAAMQKCAPLIDRRH